MFYVLYFYNYWATPLFIDVWCSSSDILVFNVLTYLVFSSIFWIYLLKLSLFSAKGANLYIYLFSFYI